MLRFIRDKFPIGLIILIAGLVAVNAQAKQDKYLFHDAHVHLTNYIQEGTDLNVYVDTVMGDKIGRSTVFGLPLQQQWSYRVTGEIAPTYYLDTDAPLYYYSFCDAVVAAQYLALPKRKTETSRSNDNWF